MCNTVHISGAYALLFSSKYILKWWHETAAQSSLKQKEAAIYGLNNLTNDKSRCNAVDELGLHHGNSPYTVFRMP